MEQAIHLLRTERREETLQQSQAERSSNVPHPLRKHGGEDIVRTDVQAATAAHGGSSSPQHRAQPPCGFNSTSTPCGTGNKKAQPRVRQHNPHNSIHLSSSIVHHPHLHPNPPSHQTRTKPRRLASSSYLRLHPVSYTHLTLPTILLV